MDGLRQCLSEVGVILHYKIESLESVLEWDSIQNKLRHTFFVTTDRSGIISISKDKVEKLVLLFSWSI